MCDVEIALERSRVHWVRVSPINNDNCTSISFEFFASQTAYSGLLCDMALISKRYENSDLSLKKIVIAVFGNCFYSADARCHEKQ